MRIFPLNISKSFAMAMAMAAAAFYILTAGGCDFGSAEVVKEVNEPHYLRAQEELRRGNVKEAMSAFLKVTEKRTDAPESHFELGRIYLDQMKDPIQAIYHFRKYLELKPNSQASPMVRQMIETAQKRFAATLPETPYENNIRRLELEEIIQRMQKENVELKHKLNAAIATIDKLEAAQSMRLANASTGSARQEVLNSASENAPGSPSQNRANRNSGINVRRDIPSTYTVQPGDTLSSISRKIYGTVNKWRQIYDANRDRMATPSSLKPGQVLRLKRL